MLMSTAEKDKDIFFQWSTYLIKVLIIIYSNVTYPFESEYSF